MSQLERRVYGLHFC